VVSTQGWVFQQLPSIRTEYDLAKNSGHLSKVVARSLASKTKALHGESHF
jgi:hypothetical protein